MILISLLASCLAQIQLRCNSTGSTSSSADSVIAPISTFPYYNAFELGVQGLSTQTLNDSKACSSWSLLRTAAAFTRSVPASCHSGTGCWSLGNKTYGSYEDSALLSPVFDFANVTSDPFLSFWIWYNTTAIRDGVVVESSTDGGNTWTELGAKTDPNWYSSTALSGGSALVDAFGGSIVAWRQVMHGLTGAAGQASYQVRWRFIAGGVAPVSGGALIDDVFVSLSPPPACPTVTSPAANFAASPLPFTIAWNGVSGVTYYQIRYGLMSNWANTTSVLAGAVSKWVTPANTDGTYNFQVLPQLADGTTNPFCGVQTFTVAARGTIRTYPSTLTFENNDFDGWSNVDNEVGGRFAVGPTQGLTGALYSPSPMPANAFVGVVSPPYNMSLLKGMIMSFDILYGFASGGVSVEFSLNRGSQWAQVGVPGAGTNWFNAETVPALAPFLMLPVASTPPGFAGSIATFQHAVYHINAGTMPAGWYPCGPEVYFRIVAATGSVGGGVGVVIDNFEIEPDSAQAAATCGPAPPSTVPPIITGAPTPMLVNPPTPPPPTPPPSTTTATTTQMPSTTTLPASTTSVTSAVSVTASASTTGGSAATTPVGGATTPHSQSTLSGGSTATVSAPTFASETLPTFAPTPVPTIVLPPSGPSGQSGSTNSTVFVLPLQTPMAPFPGWGIAIIVIGFVLCCLLLLLLLLCLARRNRKDEEEERAADDQEGLVATAGAGAAASGGSRASGRGAGAAAAAAAADDDDASELGRSESDDPEVGRAD